MAADRESNPAAQAAAPARWQTEDSETPARASTMPFQGEGMYVPSIEDANNLTMMSLEVPDPGPGEVVLRVDGTCACRHCCASHPAPPLLQRANPDRCAAPQAVF
jgi:hypothetical protein